uniref:ATP synthase complex subunit 8 n=1 Tax=Elephantulus edwardii TaxID=28737 RepID=A0A481S1C0_ELEED|nr:ATP synthase F0 subunit 8 [Elephantulus edwardii]QBG64589.1 ATP synthase F0 subunit 8 [Elephantulus edwardii]
MPQLDTSPWFIIIMSMLITLFILFQTTLTKFNYPYDPSPKTSKTTTTQNSWEMKWTKIYLPHLSLLQ